MTELQDLDRILHQDFPNRLGLSFTFNFKIQSIDNEIIQKDFIAKALYNLSENNFHIAFIIQSFELEYKNIPQLVKEVIAKANTYLVTTDRLEENNKECTFTNKVYVYTDQLKISEEKVKEYLKSHNLKIEFRDNKFRKDEFEHRRPDVFICHDSRDKKDVAQPLYESLLKNRLKVWFDEVSLEIGDSLTESIEKGIQNCRYGILILSKHFLSNEKWSKNELQSFKIKQIISKQKFILPIWHQIDESDLAQYSLWIVDKFAGDTSDGIEKVADEITKILNKN